MRSFQCLTSARIVPLLTVPTSAVRWTRILRGRASRRSAPVSDLAIRPPREWQTMSKSRVSPSGIVSSSQAMFSVGSRLIDWWSKAMTRSSYIAWSAFIELSGRPLNAPLARLKVPWIMSRVRPLSNFSHWVASLSKYGAGWGVVVGGVGLDPIALVCALPLSEIVVHDLTGGVADGERQHLEQLLAGLTEDRPVGCRSRLRMTARRAADRERPCSCAARRRGREPAGRRPRRHACLVDREDGLLEALRWLRDIELHGALAPGGTTVTAARCARQLGRLDLDDVGRFHPGPVEGGLELAARPPGAEAGARHGVDGIPRSR